ncbi:hypothetical protein [Arthrobacter sp. CAU 1506]|uniref:hypothetical protein n=1 Tax=Arthrobacter sp. CAU 1506 TaxID=2560052 RepID=UPI001F0EF9AE|nr:hypothetical protein [Arthrobacter sp. CAU 1506]
MRINLGIEDGHQHLAWMQFAAQDQVVAHKDIHQMPDHQGGQQPKRPLPVKGLGTVGMRPRRQDQGTGDRDENGHHPDEGYVDDRRRKPIRLSAGVVVACQLAEGSGWPPRRRC